ncbi:MAG: hypothetical protein AAGC76_05075 [Luteibacter sp.]|uniref:hypothetical protein n=1 Tax=Luteibacter sp. TaxID=1886636 RepID=UPI002806DD2C|nr:hypothetical protein [Luteibacter sp.]MDQ7995209.1 hypothetical protein [Luteibacter sp.]
MNRPVFAYDRLAHPEASIRPAMHHPWVRPVERAAAPERYVSRSLVRLIVSELLQKL